MLKMEETYVPIFDITGTRTGFKELILVLLYLHFVLFYSEVSLILLGLGSYSYALILFYFHELPHLDIPV